MKSLFQQAMDKVAEIQILNKKQERSTKMAQMLVAKMMVDESVFIIDDGVLVVSNSKRFDTIN